MQKKRLSAMLKKATKLLKVPPFLVAKVRKSMKTRSMKKFVLFKHYSYGFVHEYQFSPSNSPLIHQYYRNAAKKRWYQDFDSVFSRKAEREFPRSKKTISLVRSSSPPLILLREEEEEEEGEDSIDERAEKFIERFYEEIRIQRQRSSSLVQYNPFILDMD